MFTATHPQKKRLCGLPHLANGNGGMGAHSDLDVWCLYLAQKVSNPHLVKVQLFKKTSLTSGFRD